MGNSGAAFTRGVTLEHFPYLEKQHNGHGLRELRLCSGHKTNAQGPRRSNCHKKVLIEKIALGNAFKGLLKGFKASHKIRRQEDQKQLPGLKGEGFFYRDGPSKKNQRHNNHGQFFTKAATLIVMMVMMVVMVFLAMTMLMVSVLHS